MQSIQHIAITLPGQQTHFNGLKFKEQHFYLHEASGSKRDKKDMFPTRHVQ